MAISKKSLSLSLINIGSKIAGASYPNNALFNKAGTLVLTNKAGTLILTGKAT